MDSDQRMHEALRLMHQKDSVQQTLARNAEHIRRQDQKIRELRALLREQQTAGQPTMVQHLPPAMRGPVTSAGLDLKQLKATAKQAVKSRPRPRAPPTVPQKLWDRALDEAPRMPDQLRCVLRERSKLRLVHDPRMPSKATDGFASAVPGLRFRHGERCGECLRPHEEEGIWHVKFDDSEKEEDIYCGFAGLHDTSALPPTNPGLLEMHTSHDGTQSLSCLNPLSGGYYRNSAGDVIEIQVRPDVTVSQVRDAFEAHCDHPNGLLLTTPAPSRVLDPLEDHRTLEEALNTSEEESAHNRLVLELFQVEEDGTQTLFWHSGTTPSEGGSSRP